MIHFKYLIMSCLNHRDHKDHREWSLWFKLLIITIAKGITYKIFLVLTLFFQKPLGDTMKLMTALATTFLASASLGAESLDSIGLKTGTDKSSIFHNYTAVYDEEFATLRNQPIKFLEIGINRAYSVKMWEEYFPKAELHFIDITDGAIEYFSERSHYHYLDQGDKAALAAFIQETGGSFDLIIDDGGHTMKQQITSFKALFPALKPGGIYVIEDLHTSYWRSYGGGGTASRPAETINSATAFLKTLIDDLNYIGARTTCADQDKAPPELLDTLTYYQQHIKGLYFTSSLCFIIKR